jgi:hypothetical protein
MIIILRNKTLKPPLYKKRLPLLFQSLPSLYEYLNKLISHPTLKGLLVKKPDPPLHRDIENELRNVCVKIPLLQAIKDIPIYAKIIRDLCIKKLGRKKKEPPLIHVVGQLSELIYEMPYKYNDPGNPVVTIEINGISLPNTLIDLGAAINVMHFDTMQKLQIN